MLHGDKIVTVNYSTLKQFHTAASSSSFFFFLAFFDRDGLIGAVLLSQLCVTVSLRSTGLCFKHFDLLGIHFLAWCVLNSAVGVLE